jgi:carboxylesterase
LAVLAALAALAAGARAIYPRILERRERARLAVGPDGIVPGAATIHLQREKAPGALLLHGGGDTPQVLSQLAEFLHGRGFCVRAPLLPGHGRSLRDLATAGASLWHNEVRREFDAMRAKHGSVAVVGLSIGGALAIKLAAERDIPALVLLAPYVAMPAAVRRLAATTALWGWLLPYFSSRNTRSIRDADAAARALGRGLLTPLTLRAFYDVVIAAADALPLVRAPALVIQSREDNRISRESAERAFERLGSREKKLVWIEGAGHVITVDFGRERVFQLTAEWLEMHRAQQPQAGWP